MTIIDGTKSPFFAPSSKRPILRPVSTPGGTTRVVKEYADEESKSSVTGAAFNLINAIVGAGIVGIPFAVKECSLLLGVAMVSFCAALTVKSLRLIVETAKHVDVPSYERLCEVAFGRLGFIFVSVAMFVMAYGAMVSYLMVVKSSLPRLLGVHDDDVAQERAVLIISSLCIILPLSLQRDMANLAKTSIISVIFDCFIVFLVALYSPVEKSLESAGGLKQVLTHSPIHPSTFFIGLGVLSFAFVCQHSAFIIAGSLYKPTRERWGQVTGNALFTCAVLATVMGVCGFLGYMEETEGNILNNLGTSKFDEDSTRRAANVARGLLCIAMFFVYPMELFVARHVCVVLFFKGRTAHDGDDHSVLARTDRRVAVTVMLYLSSLIPALIFNDLGSVLSITGSLGGSALSYIGPGAAYLGIHGAQFLDIVNKKWSLFLTDKDIIDTIAVTDIELSKDGTADTRSLKGKKSENGYLRQIGDKIIWYILLMPSWCGVARIGIQNLKKHREEEATKSPHPSRIGKVIHNNVLQPPHSFLKAGTSASLLKKQQPVAIANDDIDEFEESMDERIPLVRSGSMPSVDAESSFRPFHAGKSLNPAEYGASNSTVAGNRGIGAAIAAKQMAALSIEDAEDDPQDNPPSAFDFFVAIFFVVFGVIAACAGLFSVFVAQ